MAVPKFLVFFQSLDIKQVNSLKKQVLTHFGRDTDVYNILEYLCERKDWRGDEYPGNEVMTRLCLQSNNQKVFLNYLSMLYDIAQEWMALEQLRKEPYEQDLLVQRWLNRNGLHQQAEQVRARVLRNLDNEVGEDYKLAKYRSEVHFEYLFCNNPDMHEYKEEDYRAMLEGFDAYFSGKTWLMMCEVHSFQSFFQQDMSQVLEHMKSKTEMQQPSRMAALAGLAYSMISDLNANAWQELTDALLKGELLEGSLMHRVLTRYAIKTGIRLWSKGKIKEIKKVGELAHYGLKTGVYSEDGKLAPASFHNLVVSLSQVFSEKELLAFVKKWSPAVDERYKDAAAKIGNAQVCFYFGKYQQIADLTNPGVMSPQQRYLAQGLDLIAGFENRIKKPDQYQRLVKNFTNYIKYNHDKLSTESLAKYRNLYRLMRDIDHKQGDLDINDYHPIYYRLYALSLIQKKNGGL